MELHGPSNIGATSPPVLDPFLANLQGPVTHSALVAGPGISTELFSAKMEKGARAKGKLTVTREEQDTEEDETAGLHIAPFTSSIESSKPKGYVLLDIKEEDVPKTKDESYMNMLNLPSDESVKDPPAMSHYTNDHEVKSVLRDHMAFINAEQSQFRKTMSRKINVLNSHVKDLSKSLKQITASERTNSQLLMQQNAILEKIASNLMFMSQQHQQSTELFIGVMQQGIQAFSASKDPSFSSKTCATASETSSRLKNESVTPIPSAPKAGARGYHGRLARPSRSIAPLANKGCSDCGRH